MKSITILGRKWRDKVNGNTYHSARVFIDGNLVCCVPFQYGYGNQFEWNAIDALERTKRFKGERQRKVSADRQNCESGWSWLRDRLGLGYVVDCADVLKRDCIAWGEME